MTTYPSQVTPDHTYTRLTIEPGDAHVVKIEMCRGTEVLYSIPTLAVPIFSIRFDLYDLENSKMTGTSVTYSPDNYGSMAVSTTTGDVVKDGTLELGNQGTILYQNVPPSSSGFPTIMVRLHFLSRPGLSAGWLDLDIDYTYPNVPGLDPARHAWQPTLMFPRIAVVKDATADGDKRQFRDYSLLTPFGDRGQMGEAPNIVDRMTAQFAALYKTEEAEPNSYAQGLAMLSTDVRGSQRNMHFYNQGGYGEMAFHMISPIFLKSKRFVTPTSQDATDYAFRLSGRDDKGYGFGGAYTHYFLRAFRVDGAAPGVAVDWRDVANLYRAWVLNPNSGRKQYFLDKNPPRPANSMGPLDNLSPFSIITNYSLDGPVTAEDPNVRPEWLEVHPMTPPVADARPDVPENKNESLYNMLVRMRSRLKNPAVRLEAQIWGFEMGGYYQFYAGYPPISNALDVNPNSQRFQTVMRKLTENLSYPGPVPGIVPSITSDPLRPQLSRLRFAGHVRYNAATDAWDEFIRTSFPPSFSEKTCARTVAKPTELHKRLFIVRQDERYPPPDPPQPPPDPPPPVKPNCAVIPRLFGDFVKNLGSIKFTEAGPTGGGGPLSNIFYLQEMGALCATPTVLEHYRNEWLPTLTGHGARLIEFMKVLGGFSCFNKEHTHITDGPTAYDNVIGYGSWAVKRVQAMCTAAYEAGRAVNPNFALTIEAAPLEPLLPYVDEFYHDAPLFRYIYSEYISTKMDLGEYPPYIHPGYKESRITGQPGTTVSIAVPTYMLEPERDEEELPSLHRWRNECRAYFQTYFRVKSYGLAPRLYQTGEESTVSTAPPPNLPNQLAPVNPLEETNPPTYTYCRSIQDVFNLRARIFYIANKVVEGERVFLSSYLFEKVTDHDPSYPYFDYNEELINLMSRAVNMQTRHWQSLRGARMLGKTAATLQPLSAIASAPRETVRAWKAPFRDFSDAKPLADKLQSTGILDFISLAYDKGAPFLVASARLPQMIWRKVFDAEGKDIRYLYLFANVGNSPLAFQFRYTHGFELAGRWGKVIRVFDGSKGGDKDLLGYEPGYNPAPGQPTERIQEVRRGDLETIFDAAHYPLAPRSFAAISLRLY